jgi:hypothetical protein
MKTTVRLVLFVKAFVFGLGLRSGEITAHLL